MMAKKSKTPAPVLQGQTVSDAFATILRHNFQYLQLWEDTARSAEDIEGVHQIRVSFRRMRSAISSFRAAIPRSVSDPWRKELGWLASQMGMARDLDVFIDEGIGGVSGILPLPGEEKLIELAKRHQAEAYITVVQMLDSNRYALFKQEFALWLDDKGWEQGELTDKQRKRLASPVTVFSRKMLDRLERRVLGAGSHVNKNNADEMHRLRIECKKLRYGAEFFVPILKGLDDFIRRMKGLQDLLGVLNDVAVMQHLLDVLLKDVDDPEILMYAGGLVGWRCRQGQELLGSFEERWEDFVHAKHPWWSKHS